MLFHSGDSCRLRCVSKSDDRKPCIMVVLVLNVESTMCVVCLFLTLSLESRE